MLRIVSTIASATEIVDALDLGRFQVGRSHECDYPPTVLDLPVCTRPRFDVSGSSLDIDRRVRATLAEEASVYEVFADVVEALEPTHILTQTQCRVCAVTLADVEKAISDRHASRPCVVALEPNSLADIWHDIERIAAACQVPERGAELCVSLQQRMNALRRPGATRVAVIEWIEPLMYAGHWIPELIEMAGGRAVTLDDDPEVVIVAPCGFDLQKTRFEARHLPTAASEVPVFLCDANQFITRPGPRVVESLQAFVEILHADEPPRLKGIAWEPL